MSYPHAATPVIKKLEGSSQWLDDFQSFPAHEGLVMRRARYGFPEHSVCSGLSIPWQLLPVLTVLQLLKNTHVEPLLPLHVQHAP